MAFLSSSTTATDVLLDRLLVHTNRPLPESVMREMMQGHSGLVLSGRAVGGQHDELFDAWPGLVVMEDPGAYLHERATPDEPYEGGADGLRRWIDSRREYVAAVLTPTRFINAQDGDSLKAAIRFANAIDDARIVVEVPVGTSWLRGGSGRQLAGVLSWSRHPTMLIVAHDTDPFETKGVLEDFRALSESATSMMLGRTDLAGLDLVARGGLAASVGLTATLRHGLSPDKRGFKIDPRDVRSAVLVGSLLHYFRDVRLKEVYANLQAPVCRCVICKGRQLDRFSADPTSRHEAEHHNLAVVLRLHDELSRIGHLRERRDAWRQEIRDAVGRHAMLSVESGVKIRPPTALDGWATAHEDD